jgi:hypothetical protein
MADKRKNIKVDAETYDRLQAHKPAGETWKRYLKRLLNTHEAVDTVEITSDQADEIAREAGKYAAREIKTVSK